MKKLTLLIIIQFFTIPTLFIFGYYFINYPERFHLFNVIKNAEWKTFCLYILGIIALSFLLSLLPLKKFKPTLRFKAFFIMLNFVLLSFMIYKMVSSFIEKKDSYNKVLIQYKKEADDDIAKGIIRYKYAGGLEIPLHSREEDMEDKIDSLRKTYGIVYVNTGCMIIPEQTRAQEEYIEYTKPYLDKRNGKGWEERMEKQIEEIRKLYIR